MDHPSPVLEASDDRLDRAERDERLRRRAGLLFGLAVIALVTWPMVKAGLAALDEQWRPTGDWAVLNLRVDDVGHLTPFVGPYSRFGWNHPGPLLYWVLAVPYHLLGGRPVALLAATALVNAAAVGAALALAWRRGGLPLLLAAGAALGLLAQAVGPALLRDPWNPYVTILPLALFTFLAWSLAEGDHWMWPAAVAVGSFLVQSHVGYAVMVGAVGVAAAFIAWRRRRTVPLLPDDRANRRALIGLVVGIAVLAWAPVVIDEVAGSGNLTEIARYFLSTDEAPAGAGVAVGQAARQLAIPDAPWLGDREPNGEDGAILGGDVGALLVPVAAFGLALLAAAKARQWSAVRFQGLVGVLAVSGLVATSRITGPVFAYLVRWWWVIACLWWLSTLWSAGVALTHWQRLPRTTRNALPWLVAPLLALVVLSTTARTAGAADDAATPDPSATEVLGHLLDPTVEALRGSGPVLVVASGSVWGTTGDAVRLELERNGIEVAAPPRDAFRFGEQRSTDERSPVATVWVVSADAATEWTFHPEVTRVASWDPLEPSDRMSYLAEEAQLRDQLIAAGRPELAQALATGGGGVDSGAADLPGVDQDLLDRVETIRRKGDPVAIFVGPATDPDDPQPPWAAATGNGATSAN
jgi:hypothetical protein